MAKRVKSRINIKLTPAQAEALEQARQKYNEMGTNLDTDAFIYAALDNICACFDVYFPRIEETANDTPRDDS